MNRVILTGRLTADPEMRTTPGGRNVSRMRIAVPRNKDRTDFLNCVAWDRGAEMICRYFHKGSRIGLEGRLISDEYQDRDGNRRVKVEVFVDRVEFIDPKSDVSDKNTYYAPDTEQAKYAAQQSTPAEFDVISSDDDLPF